MSESLSRSRHRWISDGLFEKYWSKPHKRKGVLIEDPKNPPKDTMTKVGSVTICIEPHIVEATMYVVKDPKSKQPLQKLPKQPLPPHPQPQQLARPVLQYGPPNGSMPPPPTPKPAAAAPSTPNPSVSRPASASPAPSTTQPSSASPLQAPRPVVQPPPAAPTMPNQASQPMASPNTQIASQSPRPQSGPPLPPSPASTKLPAPMAPRAAPNTSQVATNQPVAGKPPATQPAAAASPAASSAPSPARPPANDPVIALLAQKASNDTGLRNLMKRVAVGQAKDGELAQFQKIINQLTKEYKQKQEGLAPERLIVDGRTVKYFAEEVKAILEIVLASNPNQRSSELRPPPRSDPLVVLLVKTALEDQRTKDMIKRIAEGRPSATDGTDLKEIIDRLHRDAKTTPQTPVPATPARQPTPNNIVPNGQPKPATVQGTPQPNPQALRSKGPPPAAKHDVTAVLFDFGSGDRYLFPKFSILEYLPTQSGQQVVTSFLIVRKGSTSEYGGDPKLDYYQPVTIRLYTLTGRILENLARVVAPQDEVRRYMDDVMDNMTRAEYVLLAMRLPREAAEDQKESLVKEEPRQNGETHQTELQPKPGPGFREEPDWIGRLMDTIAPAQQKYSLRVTPGPSTPQEDLMASIDSRPRWSLPLQKSSLRDAEQETEAAYQRLINSVAAKNTGSA